MLMTRHRFYDGLHALCLLLFAGFAAPQRWLGMVLVGYLLLGVLLLLGLGRPLHSDPWGWRDRLFPLLGLTTLTLQTVWLLTPVSARSGSLVLLGLWTLFVATAALRLVRLLSLERRVTLPMIRGAAAGYLLLGLTGALLMNLLEWERPGSFALLANGQVLQRPLPLDGNAWAMDLGRIGYFAFVCLTTVGFGDITPLTPPARMLSVGLAMVGPLYLAVVMGVLIGRFSADSSSAPGGGLG